MTILIKKFNIFCSCFLNVQSISPMRVLQNFHPFRCDNAKTLRAQSRSNCWWRTNCHSNSSQQRRNWSCRRWWRSWAPRLRERWPQSWSRNQPIWWMAAFPRHQSGNTNNWFGILLFWMLIMQFRSAKCNANWRWNNNNCCNQHQPGDRQSRPLLYGHQLLCHHRRQRLRQWTCQKM